MSLFSEFVFGIAPRRQHSCLFCPVSVTSLPGSYCSPLHLPSTFPSVKCVPVGFHIIIGEEIEGGLKIIWPVGNLGLMFREFLSCPWLST